MHRSWRSTPGQLLKKVEQVRTIIGTMREHNEQCRALVGKDFALITVRRYESCTRYLAEHIVQDNNGHYWIRKTRQKTNNMCNIPLLDIPLAILKKYENHQTCIKRGVLLPVPCNQI